MQTLLLEIAYALYLIMPAYVANAVPVLLGGGQAIDDGKVLSDGKPIFGSHKTVRGFLAGVMIGTAVGTVQTAFLDYRIIPDFTPAFSFTIILSLMLSIGALTGDLVHSFIKRRIGIREGGSLPVADQLDFVVGAILFSFLVSTPPWLTIVLIFSITLPVHVLTNFLAYLLGIKKTPW